MSLHNLVMSKVVVLHIIHLLCILLYSGKKEERNIYILKTSNQAVIHSYNLNDVNIFPSYTVIINTLSEGMMVSK